MNKVKTSRLSIRTAITTNTILPVLGLPGITLALPHLDAFRERDDANQPRKDSFRLDFHRIPEDCRSSDNGGETDMGSRATELASFWPLMSVDAKGCC